MYESPINKVVGEIQSQIIKQDDENIIYAVKQAAGYSVDKNELIKALKYDREQYEKGYRDGLNADKWIPVSERLPEEEYDTVLAVTNKNHYSVFVYTKEHGFRTADIDMEGDVVAWMPLEPYKGE